jgi:DNA-binding SARP family transcriptional activator
MAIRITVFGQFRVLDGDVELSSRSFDGRKPRQILQILAAHHGRVMSKERLADLLWWDSPPAHPAGSIEHYVAVLRRRLHGRACPDRPIVQTEGSGYSLDVSRVSVDLADFRSAVADVSTWLHIERVRAALRLSESDAFTEEPDAEWAESIRREVEGRRCDLLVRAAELGLADGDALAAARDAAEAIAVEPHLESAHRVLIAAHYLHGDQARALAAYRSLRDSLVAELGVDPVPQTQGLHSAVLSHSRPDDILRRLTVPQGLRSA